MAPSQCSRVAARPVLLLLILVCIAALTGSLATRTFHINICDRAAASSNSSHPMHQHLDRDASHWVAPVRHLLGLRPSPTTFYVPLPESHIASLISVENLYNRPPPSL